MLLMRNKKERSFYSKCFSNISKGRSSNKIIALAINTCFGHFIFSAVFCIRNILMISNQVMQKPLWCNCKCKNQKHYCCKGSYDGG